MNAIMQPQLIETLRIAPDRSIPLLPRHLARLRASAAALGYACDAAAIERSLSAAAANADGPGSHRLRLLVDADGAITLQAAPLPDLPAGQSIVLDDAIVIDPDQPLLRHKTTHRPWYEPAAAWLAGHPQVFDRVYLNTRGELCEGSRSNLYLKLDGIWWTPPLSSGCLPGVQRAELLETGQARERILPAALLREARALRLSNALRGWMDVTLEN